MKDLIDIALQSGNRHDMYVSRYDKNTGQVHLETNPEYAGDYSLGLHLVALCAVVGPVFIVSLFIIIYTY